MLLQFVQQEIREKNLIPDNQRGFIDDYSTYDNIIDLLLWISQSRRIQLGYRNKRVKVCDRVKQYVLFIDFRRAFDKVRRSLSIKKLLEIGMDTDLVFSIQHLLSETKVIFGEDCHLTNIGTPQRSCLSPLLWNLFVADLCRDLNNVTSSNLRAFAGIDEPEIKARALFFADDLAIYCENKEHFERSWIFVERWAEKHFI